MGEQCVTFALFVQRAQSERGVQEPREIDKSSEAAFWSTQRGENSTKERKNVRNFSSSLLLFVFLLFEKNYSDAFRFLETHRQFARTFCQLQNEILIRFPDRRQQTCERNITRTADKRLKYCLSTCYHEHLTRLIERNVKRANYPPVTPPSVIVSEFQTLVSWNATEFRSRRVQVSINKNSIDSMYYKLRVLSNLSSYRIR